MWVNYNDLTVLPNPGIMVSKGNYPQMPERRIGRWMAELFRLVNYYDLPRYIYIYIYHCI